MRRRHSILALTLALGPLGGVAGVAIGAPKKEKSNVAAEPKAIPPDPTPLVSGRQWVLDLEYRAGEVHLLSVSERKLTSPSETPRAMGRFALELFEGPTLVERVRFDFPLLVEGEDAGPKRPPSITHRLTSRIGVLFPVTSRGNRLELWDRGTDRRWNLPWPPSAMVDGGRADAQ